MATYRVGVIDSKRKTLKERDREEKVTKRNELKVLVVAGTLNALVLPLARPWRRRGLV